MAIVYVNPREYKIFKSKPSYGTYINFGKFAKTFKYTTNNPKRLTGIVAKKGHTLRYSK